MSETSSLVRLPSPSRIKAEHHISLVDHTVSRAASYQGLISAELSDSDGATTPAGRTLSKRLTNSSTGIRQTVRQEINKQKYSRYTQDRYNVGDAGARGSDESLTAPQEAAEPSTPLRTPTYLTRAQSKVQSKAKAFMNRKRTLGKGDAEDTIVDILYENQRGMFFFGIPKYSSASLLPSDPRPWQNGQFRTSAVDIRNAQVPDPSWEWAWKSWYVDMSRDVDEEGWEYSFAFVGRGGATFAWHGNHPWFHSFVRRRRWLRMRKRKDNVHRTQEKAHELTSDYFTIHPRTLHAADALSRNGSSTLLNAMAKVEPTVDVEKMDIMSIGDLLLALRKSTVDREKILAVRKFLEQGGEELYYLNERMEDIMGTLMFQSSRRQLLSGLISKHDQLRQEQKDLASHEHEDDLQKQQEHDKKARHAANLHKAIHAADEQVKKLEYWSDIRDVSGAAAAVEAEEAHSEPSFKNKQPAAAGAPVLGSEPNGKRTGDETAYETANDGKSTALSKKSSIWFDSESRTTKSSKGRDSNAAGDTEPERFETAPEYPENASQKSGRSKGSKGKGKARATNLDGVAEDASEEHDTFEELISPTTGARSNGRSVQILEPVALDSINSDDYQYDSDDDDQTADGTRSPVDRGEAKTPDSIGGFMVQMRTPKNWIDQAFG